MSDTVANPTSLANLHDIVVPPPTSWWPPAAGWYLLGVLLLIAATWLVVAAIRHWRKNRYRAAGIALLKELRQSSRQATPGEVVAELNRLLKRVALARWPRRDVAQLVGAEWIDFLDRTGPTDKRFTTDQAHALRDVAYSDQLSQQLTAAQLGELFMAADRWIRQHHDPASEHNQLSGKHQS